MRAEGSFDIRMHPLATHAEGADGVNLGHLTIDKECQGDIEAVSIGEMLSARCSTAGSAGYVAIEQVRGTVHGRSGSFVLQHYGMMHGGTQRLILEVVPDSGSGELSGIAGSMRIIIENGKHRYEFDYTLP